VNGVNFVGSVGSAAGVSVGAAVEVDASAVVARCLAVAGSRSRDGINDLRKDMVCEVKDASAPTM